MKFNWKFNFTWGPELKSTLVNSIAGGALGTLTAYLQTGTSASLNSKIALALMLAVSYGFGILIQKVTTWNPKKKMADGITEKADIKWWLGNGFYPFFILWLFCWIIFYNVFGGFPAPVAIVANATVPVA